MANVVASEILLQCRFCFGKTSAATPSTLLGETQTQVRFQMNGRGVEEGGRLHELRFRELESKYFTDFYSHFVFNNRIKTDRRGMNEVVVSLSDSVTATKQIFPFINNDVDLFRSPLVSCNCGLKLEKKRGLKLEGVLRIRPKP